MDEYRLIARFYDFLLEPFIHRMRTDLVAWTKQNRIKHILDLGCGTGKQLSLLPKEVASWGLDISVHMLRQTKKNLGSCCIRGDVSSLPFSSQSFDLVFSQFALHEKDAQIITAELSEAKRVLKRSGWLMILDFAISANGSFKAKMIGKGIKFVEWNAGSEHFNNYKKWLEQGGIDNLLTNAGWQKATEKAYFGGNLKMVFFRQSAAEKQLAAKK
jgi:ubiquinone/menaquinone biosynthesis C-methylase UbiE